MGRITRPRKSFNQRLLLAIGLVAGVAGACQTGATFPSVMVIGPNECAMASVKNVPMSHAIENVCEVKGMSTRSPKHLVEELEARTLLSGSPDLPAGVLQLLRPFAWVSEAKIPLQASGNGKSGNVPATPTGLVAIQQSISSIRLSWVGSFQAGGYGIQRSSDNANTWSTVANVSAGTTSYTDMGLTPGSTYTYAVVATSSGGSSSPSKGVTLSPILPPAPPSSLVATASSPTSIQLTWTDNSNNESGFIIQRQVAGSSTWTAVATTDVNSTSFTDTGLTPQTDYAYEVLATDVAGSSAPSNVATATTPLPPPNAPTLTNADAFSAAQINLAWKDNADNEDNFLVEESTDGTTYNTVATLPPNSTSYSVTGLTPNTKYTFRIFAKNSAGTTTSDVLAATTKQNVTVDGNGWTTIVSSADSRIVYVSSSSGNDTNSGLSPNAPVKTIAKGYSLLRSGMPDELLLKSGDTFTDPLGEWRKSGRSATEPIVLSDYGTGARPVLVNTGISSSSPSTPTNYVCMTNLSFIASSQNPADPSFSGGKNYFAGVTWLSGNGLLIENCSFQYYAFGMVIQSNYGNPSNVIIRRDQVLDSYSLVSHSSGAYLQGIHGLTLSQNIFDHNGWNEQVPGGEANIYNHNVYIKEDCTDVVVTGNTFAEASSHGLQARSGGDIENNLFINNPIGMSFGLANGSPVTAGGVCGKIAGNVFIGDRDINGALRGWAIEISNTKAGGGTVIENNVITGDTQKNAAAIQLNYGINVDNPADAVGINDLTIRNNIISGWNSAIWINSNMVFGGTGAKAINGLSVTGNDFQQPFSGLLIDQGPAFDSRYETWSNNRYFSTASADTWFKIAGTVTSWLSWQANVDTTGTNNQVNYPDQTRNLSTYSSSIGGAGTISDLLQQMRQQSRSNWLDQYTAQPIIKYIDSGFGK